MNRMSSRFVVSVFVVLMLVEVYVGVVQIVGLMKSSRLLSSVVLQGSRRTSNDSRFSMGDVLRLTAWSDNASFCKLSIFRNSSLAWESTEFFCGSVASFSVRLVAPAFGVGRYFAVVDACALNCPVVGADSSDCEIVPFEVVSVKTSVGVSVEYSGDFRRLRAWANLTDGDGFPVVNETVCFKFKSADRERVTDGWVPLDVAVTGVDGGASVSAAFGAPDGNYSVMAFHEGNEDFGECRNSSRVAVVRNESYGEGFVGESGSLFSGGNLTIIPSTIIPYAVLPVNMTARYVVDVLPEGGHVSLLFFLDSIDHDHMIGGSPLIDYVNVSGCYVFDYSVWWHPDVVGTHKVIAAVANGSAADFVAAMNGVGIIASVELAVLVRVCPSNIVFSVPTAVCGDILPITAAFARARAYGGSVTDFFETVSLASRLRYNGVWYAVAEPVGGVPVGLFVNDSFRCANATGWDGVAGLPLDLSGTGIPLP